MNIALHGCHQNLAGSCCSTLFFCLDMRLKDRNCRFHRASCLDNLRQEHFAFSKKFAYQVHAVHQRTLNYVYCMRIFGKCFVNILLQEIGDSLAQRILQTFFHTLLSPFRSSRFLGSNTACLSCSLGSISLSFYLCRKLDKFISCTFSPIQHHILDELKLFFRNFIVIHSGFGIYNTKVHTYLLGMMQENTMDSLTDISIATE